MTGSNAADDGVRTEADADVAIVMPYLRSAGIAAGQVRAQRSFSLQLGRGILPIDADRPVARGRLDYLIVRDDGRPLFVVEVKAPGLTLTDGDRDQGISYARLVHPIAPVVVLTNGRETRLFDSFTKEPIGDGEIEQRINRPHLLAAEDDLRARYEALQCFLGYSPDNVAAVSAAQCSVRMRSLRGAAGEEPKKYVANAYVRRDAVRRELDIFLASDKTTFALVGESGTGKSNEMCALAEEYGRQHVVLFFSGTDLSASLAESLADEFSWRLSEALPLQQICRRLAGLGRQSGRPVLIFIDAIDEVESANIAGELSELAIRLAEFDGWIRLAVSAKVETWPRFLLIRGVERGISDGLYVPRASGVESGNGGIAIPASYLLKRFGDAERDDAIARYARVFGLPNLDSRSWTPAMHKAASDPFMLRVIAEVTARRGELPRDPNEKDIVRNYVEAKIERMAEPARSRVELAAVARALLEQSPSRALSLRSAPDNATLRHAVDEGAVLALLRLSGTDTVADELVAFGVLTRVVDDAGRARLTFGYDRVRDFVVATRVFRFQELDPVRFEQEAERAFDTHIGTAALRWFLPFATEAQRPAFVEVARRRLVRMVNTYDAIRNSITETVRAKMEPRTTGHIGVAFSVNLPAMIFGLALFRRADPSAPQVVADNTIFEGWGQPTRRPTSTLVPHMDVGTAHLRGGFWYLDDPELFAAEHARDEILKLAKEGQLNEATAGHLRRERVLALTTVHEQSLGLQNNRGFDSDADRHLVRHLLPLDLADLDRRVQELLAVASYRQSHSDAEGERHRAAAAPGQRFLVWSMSFTRELLDAFARRAGEAVASGERFTSAAPHDEMRALAESVEILLHEQTAITSSLLPPPDVSGTDRIRTFEQAYSDGQLKDFCKALFAAAIEARDAVIAGTFLAPLAGAIQRSRWSGTPGQRIFIVFQRRDASDQNFRRGGTLAFALGPRPQNGDGPISVEAMVGPAGSNRVIRHGSLVEGREPCWLIDTDSGTVPLDGWSHFAFSNVFYPSKRRPFVARGNTNSTHFAPVRSTAYDMVERDLEGLTAHAILLALRISH